MTRPPCIDIAHTDPVKPTHTPPRSVRVPDPLWNAAKATAEERGESVTDVIVRALDRYVKRNSGRAPTDAGPPEDERPEIVSYP